MCPLTGVFACVRPSEACSRARSSWLGAMIRYVFGMLTIAGVAGVSTLEACGRLAGGKRRRTRRHRLPIGTSVVPRQGYRRVDACRR